jgi:ABC-2 type transport system permease protein
VTVFATLAELTFRGLLGRRRTILLLLLAALPVLVAVLARIGGARLDDGLTEILELVVRTVLPLTALVFGVSALGSEIDDGTVVFILAKPIPRWLVVVAKGVVAGTVAATLSVASTLATGLMIAGADAEGLATTVAFAVAIAIAAFAYASLFVALSVVTGRALFIGLVYTLVWEGVLAGILPGTQAFSLREATLTLAEALAPAGAAIDGDREVGEALLLIVLVIVGSLLLATSRLRAFEVRGTE